MKNTITYRLAAPIEMHPRDLEEKMGKMIHVKPSPGQYISQGFVPPLGAGGDLLEDLDNEMYLLAIMTSKRDLPSAVINAELNEAVKKVEDEEDRSISKGERQRMKESVVARLLPRAFVKTSMLQAILTPNFIFVDASSEGRAEDILHHLRSAIGSLKVAPLSVNSPVPERMSGWLTSGGCPIPQVIQVSSKTLRLANEKGREFATYQNVDPFGDNILEMLAGGMRAVELQLETEHSSLRVNDSVHLKAIKWDASVKRQAEADGGEDDHHLTSGRASYLLYANYLLEIIEALIEEFGGMPELVGSEQEEDAEFEDEVDEDLFNGVRDFVAEEQRVDLGDIESEFDITTNMASLVVERLERHGIVGDMREDGSRMVMLNTDGTSKAEGDDADDAEGMI